jgi:hypothetical protein
LSESAVLTPIFKVGGVWRVIHLDAVADQYRDWSLWDRFDPSSMAVQYEAGPSRDRVIARFQPKVSL